MKKVFIFNLIMFLIIACQPTRNGIRETPVPTDTEYCGAAEIHLKEMCKTNPEENLYCCQTSESTKKGKTFTEFCTETQRSGIFLNPRCLSSIKSCQEIDYCTGTKQ